MVNWSDPQTFWLNVMNAALGAVCLVCVALFLVSVAQEIGAWLRQRSVRLAQLRDHAFSVPGLGLTMADGGEPLDQDDRKAKPAPKPQGPTQTQDAPDPPTR